MKQDLIAKAEVDIAAPTDAVWAALVDPATVQQYMFGTDLVTDWRVGSPIRTPYSPLSGQPDEPESYHTVTIRALGGR